MEDVGEEIITFGTNFMHFTVPKPQFFLSLEELVNDDKSNAFNSSKRRTLLEVDFKLELDQVYVLAVEEVL